MPQTASRVVFSAQRAATKKIGRVEIVKFTKEEKHQLVARYHNGESATDICTETGVARSTFYTWLKPYKTRYTDTGYVVSTSEFIKMKQPLEKLEQKIEVLQKVNCTVSSPLKEKLRELALL